MRTFLTLIAVVLASVATLNAKDVNALDNVARPCEHGLLLKIDYQGFGMIGLPQAELLYLQVCRDGAFAYQTVRGQLRTGTLDGDQLRRLEIELSSPDTQRLDAHYTAPMAIDASVSLSVVIPGQGHTRLVKVDNLVTAWLAPPLDRLVSIADSFRTGAGFTVTTFRPHRSEPER